MWRRQGAAARWGSAPRTRGTLTGRRRGAAARWGSAPRAQPRTRGSSAVGARPLLGGSRLGLEPLGLAVEDLGLAVDDAGHVLEQLEPLLARSGVHGVAVEAGLLELGGGHRAARFRATAGQRCLVPGDLGFLADQIRGPERGL